MGLAGVVGLLLACFGFAATATADPGAPALNAASSAVYPSPDTNQDVCPIDMSADSTVDTAKRQVAGGETTEECPRVLGASGSGELPGGDAGASGEVSESSALPFTGFSAPLLLAISMLMLGVGLALRRIRPKSASSHR
jgi:hypothetical protein